MGSVNTTATHKFVIVVNEKSPPGKILSATGQLAMSLYGDASPEQREQMSFLPFVNPDNLKLINLTTCSFVVLKGTGGQLLTLYHACREKGILSAIFTSTMSFNGIEENLSVKTSTTPLEQTEPYGVGLFGLIDEVSPLTKKFSLFK